MALSYKNAKKSIELFMKKTILPCLVLALFFGMGANAQKPYDKDELYEIGQLSDSGKASITEFVSWMLSEPEDELFGPMSEAWDQYQRHQPLDKGTSVFLDEKSGYFRYDVDLDKKYEEDEPTGSTLFVEMCVWNCADGKHKIFADYVGGTEHGKPHDGWQYDGYTFYLYDKATHKIYVCNEVIASELSSLIPSQEWQYDGGEWYYATDYVTGEKKRMTSEEFDQWLEDWPVMVLSLPRTGKNIKATIYSVKGTEEKELVWDGYRFHLSE